MYRRVMPPPPARHLQRQPAVRRGLTARARLMPDNSLASPQRLLFGQKRPAGEPARYSKLGYPSSPGLSSAPPVNVRGAMRRALLAPAGITATGYSHPDDADCATGYVRLPNWPIDPDHRPEDRRSCIAAMPASSTISGVARRQRMREAITRIMVLGVSSRRHIP